MATIVRLSGVDYLGPTRELLEHFDLSLAENSRVLPVQDWNQPEAVTLVTDRTISNAEGRSLVTSVQAQFREAGTAFHVGPKLMQITTEEWATLQEQLSNSLHVAPTDPIHEQSHEEGSDEAGSIGALDLGPQHVLRDLNWLSNAEDLKGQFSPSQEFAAKVLAAAIARRASDIRIHPMEGEGMVLFKIDGDWREVQGQIRTDVLKSAINVFATASKVEQTKMHRTGGNGELSTTLTLKGKGNQRYDLRISILPIKVGSSQLYNLVVRIQDKFNLRPLEKLDFSARNMAIIEQSLSNPYGMIFVIGPTGSGKSTLVQALLRRLLTLYGLRKHFITLEDPVEFPLPEMSQVEIDPRQERTWEVMLEQVMRHAPDIIMLGELRGRVTADAAVYAAQSGHLVLGTLHANSVAGIPQRLVNIGVERSNVSSVFMTGVGQRLVKRIIPEMWAMEELTAAELRARYGLVIPNVPDTKLYPCPVLRPDAPPAEEQNCKGRVAIHEVMRVSERIREAISEGADPERIERMALEEGHETLLHDGLRKMAQGLIAPIHLRKAIQL